MTTDPALTRIADALDRLSPPPDPAPSFAEAEAYVWHTAPDRLKPVPRVSRVPLDQLVGIDRARDTLLANTLQFARGHAATGRQQPAAHRSTLRCPTRAVAGGAGV